MNSHSPNIPEEDLKWIQNNLRRILPNVKIYIFGSRANNTASLYSDLDIALKNISPISFAEISKIRESFSESKLLYKVDIVDLDNVDDEFKKRILLTSIEI